MKTNLVKYLCAISILFGLNSCLDLEPQDQIGGDNMWITTSEFKNFANTFYSWLPDFGTIYKDGSAHSDSRSDIVTYQTVSDYSHGNYPVLVSDGNYTGNYAHIRRCNLLIQNAANYSQQEDIKQYVGEAYFFRAYCYFELVQLYGDAIITTTALDLDSPELQVERNDRSEVIDLVVSDLNQAIVRLSPAAALSEEGRVSRQAAQAFLSRVALYEGTWQKFHNSNTARAKQLLGIAADAAKAVIDSKQYSLFGTSGNSVALGDSAQKYLFTLENDVQCNPASCTKSDNHEYILAKRHDTTLSPIGRNITNETVNNPQWITRNFVDLYLCDDGLPIDKSPKFQGRAKMNDEFKNRDNRMRFNLLEPGRFYWKNSFGRSNWGAGATANAKKYDGKNGSGYNNQKWGTERSCKDGEEGYDYPVIRYAEVLLNYAEAVFERDNASIGGADLDISLNLVRRRVNPNMPKLSMGFCSANGLDMRDEIRRERTVELYQEGFRIDDLKRWAKAVSVMSNPLLGVKFSGTEYQTSGWNHSNVMPNGEGFLILDQNRQWTDRNYLLPLPKDQLELNPNLKQNPGW